MIPAADYSKAVYALMHPVAPAYVSFVTSATASGLAGDSDPAHTVFVRTKDGTIVAGSIENFSTGHYRGSGEGNPITHPVFNAACYTAKDEQQASWESRQVLRLTLQPTCTGQSDGGDYPFRTLYVDPATLAPLGVEGNVEDEGVSVDLAERFARFGAYVLPSDLSVHVHGHGWLFWVRERGSVTYSDYKFYDRLPQGVTRRQAGSPGG